MCVCVYFDTFTANISKRVHASPSRSFVSKHKQRRKIKNKLLISRNYFVFFNIGISSIMTYMACGRTNVHYFFFYIDFGRDSSLLSLTAQPINYVLLKYNGAYANTYTHTRIQSDRAFHFFAIHFNGAYVFIVYINFNENGRVYSLYRHFNIEIGKKVIIIYWINANAIDWSTRIDRPQRKSYS